MVKKVLQTHLVRSVNSIYIKTISKYNIDIQINEKTLGTLPNWSSSRKGIKWHSNNVFAM